MHPLAITFKNGERVEVEEFSEHYTIYRYIEIVEGTGHRVGDLRVLPHRDFDERTVG